MKAITNPFVVHATTIRRPMMAAVTGKGVGVNKVFDWEYRPMLGMCV